MRLNIWGASGLALTIGAFSQTALVQPVWAQATQEAAADTSGGDVETVVVTGTRRSGVTAEASAAPIEVVVGDNLASAGLPNLSQELTRLVPSFSSPSYGADTAALTKAAVLRGLSPNHVLVLVNGKRRHASANIIADPGPNQGSNPVDLDLIPSAAIDHIEVLTDGAAAQYGSDALAGVINIILKSNSSGGSVSATAGQYYGSKFPEVHETGDGLVMDTMGNSGFGFADSGYLNLTAEYRHHLNSNNTGPDLRGAAGGVPSDPYQSRIEGDPESSEETLTFNTGIDLDVVDLYSFGTYTHRHSKAFENYRTETKIPNNLPPGSTLPNVYPLGFEPAETLTEDDYSLTGGVKGQVLGWNWDLSSTYGSDNDDIGNVGGLNIQLYGATGTTPTEFRTGNLDNSEWTNNLDFTKDYDIGLAAPLNIAVGGEYRYETFELVAGDPASRYGAGSQANPGFSLTDAHNVHRDNTGVYVDFSTKIITDWQVDVAGRYEHFSDSGNTKDGKISTRYDFAPEFGVRATVSNGFRAPSLEQEYFSATNVGPGFASAQLPVNSAGAALLGAVPLKPEVSNNYSIGLVSKPISHMRVTLDAYQINIHNRIIDTGLFTGDQALAAVILNGNGVEPGASVTAQYFANAATTHTRGIEFSTSYLQDYGDKGSVNYSLTANYNNTVAIVSAGGIARYFQGGSAAFGTISALDSSLAYLTNAAPHTKIILQAYWSNDPWDVTVRGTYYGASYTYDVDEDEAFYYKDAIKPAFIPDLEVGYTLASWHVALGANNVFNQFPNKFNPKVTATADYPINTVIYNHNSPYGYQGGFYYGRVTYTF